MNQNDILFRLITSIVIIFSFSCDKVELDNPLDILNPNYTDPSVTILYIPEIIDTDTLTISWEGNVDAHFMEFSFNIDNGEWSAYSQNINTLLKYLDEDTHAFYVRAKYIGNEESSVDTISFMVDAIQGPSIRVFPLKHEMELNSNFDIEIIAEEVEGIRYFECIIEYDPQKINYSSNQPGAFFTNANLFFVDDETPGTIAISAGELSNSDGYTGTGSIIKLSFLANAVTNSSGTQITITTDSAYFDINGNEITVDQRKGGLVVIQ